MKEEFKLARVANHDKLWNAYGPTGADQIQQIIDTQTHIVAGVIDTKYYTLLGQKVSDFVPFDVGTGADSLALFQYTSEYVGNDFKSGLIDIGNGLQQNALADINVSGFSVKVNFWRFDYKVSAEQIAVASKNAVSFSIIEAKEKARKKVWDLGIQDVLFNGLGDGETYGINNQPNVTVNTSLLPVKVTAMTAAQAKTFASTVVATYLANNNTTQLPNRWLMPTNEFVGLGVAVDPTYPLKTLKEILEDAFKEAGCVDFKIVHSTYNNTADSTGTLGRHVFYNYDPESIRMFVPKDYTPSALFPFNALDMISTAQGQFTGVVVFRPKEMLYADVQA